MPILELDERFRLVVNIYYEQRIGADSISYNSEYRFFESQARSAVGMWLEPKHATDSRKVLDDSELRRIWPELRIQ